MFQHTLFDVHHGNNVPLITIKLSNIININANQFIIDKANLNVLFAGKFQYRSAS